VEGWEKELHAVFPVVQKHTYEITLHLGTAEEFMEYIQQVCRPVREIPICIAAERRRRSCHPE